MTQITDLPNNDSGNGWANTLPPRLACSPLSEDISCDWLVIGAGFAGLAAARRLSENNPEDRVVIVDACKVGDGASARNSGFVIDLPHNVGSDLDNLDMQHRSLRLARAAVTQLEDIVQTNAIDCQWSHRGQYMAAASDKGEAVLDGFSSGLDALGESYQKVSADDLNSAIGTSYYRRAIFTPGTILMQPAALVCGLADTLPESVELYEDTPVTSSRFGSPHQFSTPNGSIRARQVILAVNGFAPAFNILKGRVFSLQLLASMTRVLSDGELVDLGCEPDWGLVPALPFGGPTMRLTQDRRLVMRSVFSYRHSRHVSAGQYQKAGALQARQIQARFGALPAGIIKHTWAGNITLSQNFAPGFGKQADGVYSAVCQNGVGVTKGTISGILAADLASGRDNPLISDMETLGVPCRLPPRPFLDLGITAKLKWWVRSSRVDG